MPGEGPTLKRVDYVCTEAEGAGSPEAVADALHDALVAKDNFDVSGQTAGWALLDGGTGDCDNQALCMVLCVRMVGAGPASLEHVRASSDYGAGNCLDQEDRAGPPHQWLFLDFDPGPGYNWNAWEGCCLTAGHYYAITPDRKKADDYQMLLALPGQQYWVETQDDIRPGDPACVILLPPFAEQPKQ
jgi:hypothetical protein